MRVELEQQTDAPSESESSTTLPSSRWCHYNSPLIQITLITLAFICCPGLFNVLSTLLSDGHVNKEAANTAFNSTLAVFSILGSGILNLIGPRLTLFAGCITYILYAIFFRHCNHPLFFIVTNAVLGMGAGLLWAAQGTIITSYPPPQRKGAYISLFWWITNLGGVIKGLVLFILKYDPTTAKSMSNSAYIAFICIMGFGAVLSILILPPTKLVRHDGTCSGSVVTSKKVSTEALEIVKLFTNWKMLLFMPAAWTSNVFCTYQFNNVNGVLLNLRTEGLNVACYWGAQMVGSVALGYLLDSSFKSRRKRGFLGIGVVAAMSTVIWAGWLLYQLWYNKNGNFGEGLDFRMVKFAGEFVLCFNYGLLDAMFQSLCYWVIGALADDAETLSR